MENGIFEQLSCSRLEQFWVEWRNKIFDMAKELRETQVGFAQMMAVSTHIHTSEFSNPFLA